MFRFLVLAGVAAANLMAQSASGNWAGDEATFESRDASGHASAFRLTIGEGRLTGELKLGGRAAALNLIPLTSAEAVVVVSARFGPNGQLTKFTVNRSQGLGMDENSLEAAKALTFKPPIRGTVDVIVPR